MCYELLFKIYQREHLISEAAGEIMMVIWYFNSQIQHKKSRVCALAFRPSDFVVLPRVWKPSQLKEKQSE